MKTYYYYNPVKIIFGLNSLEKLSAIIDQFCENRNILVVCGKSSLKKSGKLDWIVNLLKKSHFNVIVYDRVDSNPTYSFIDSSVDYLFDLNISLILGIGGGSAMDCAKCMAILARNPGKVMDFLVNKKPLKNIGIPLITIPTTSGTGSEVTSWATVWDLGQNKKKYSLSNEMMYAKASIIDPELTLSMPPRLIAISALDALCQAIEAYWSRNHNPISDSYAIEAIKLIVNNIISAYNAPSDINFRIKLALGSLKSGLAFSNTKTTAVHSLSYPMTMYFNIPHGLACALTLGQFIIYNSKSSSDNLPESPKRIKIIAEALGVSGPNEAAEKITELMKKMNLPTRLSEAGISENNIDLIIEKGFTPDRVSHNPRVVTAMELKKILQNIK